jgi:hypothetical protein
MIVFLWQAGTAEGVTDDCEKALKQAASFMHSTGASTALVEQARFTGGNRSLSSGYRALQGPYWVARRHHGGQVSWEPNWPAPEPTAA